MFLCIFNVLVARVLTFAFWCFIFVLIKVLWHRLCLKILNNEKDI